MQLTKHRWVIPALFVALAAFTTNVALADHIAVATASGTVLTPITVTKSNDLDFGSSIFPGIDKSVTATSASAAKFTVGGEAGKQVTIVFDLPTELTKVGGATMPISFGATDAGRNTGNVQAEATSFDPNSTETTTLEAENGTLYIWLGGTVSPAHNQSAGEYSADITVTLEYTGS